MKVYNKLVRDKILKILKTKGKGYKHYIADADEYREKLYEKLQEEILEFKENPSVEEFADMLEVLEAIGKFHDFHLDKIKEVKANKKYNRGSFDNRIILEKAEE